MREPLILDPWTPLNHKASMQVNGGMPFALPSWADLHRRRLTAYRIRQAYIDLAARHFYSSDAAAEDRREYGDAALIVETGLQAVLGDEVTIYVDGAEQYDPALEGQDPPADGDEQRENTPEARAAFERQEWLRAWATTAKFSRHLRDAARGSLGLGDGVIQLSPWRGRVKIRTYDPGFYFPILSSAPDDDEYPTRVHLAWEEEDARGAVWVHRITYELAPIEGVRDGNGLPVFARSATPDGGELIRPVVARGDVVLPDGRIARRYPWQAPDEPASTITCYLTHAVWRANDVREDIDLLTNESATRFEVNDEGLPLNRLDLRLDFIPLVHKPGHGSTIPEHFGHSLIDYVVQVLDDLSNNDTDLAAAAGTTATPAIAVTGTKQGSGTVDHYGPGTVFYTGEGGRMDVLDTSAGLTALIANEERLLKRLARNSRMPAAALGDADPSDFASGLHLALSYGPLRGLVTQLREDWVEKDALVLRFVQRMAMAIGDPTIPTGPTPAAGVAYGSFLPSDRAELVKMVTELFRAKLVSRLTAIRMLIEGGFDYTDAADEVTRIEREDFEGAGVLLDVAGEQAAAEYLGRPVDLPEPEPAPPPRPVLP